ncbi:MAG TPA: PVC-type heme-binding CxxCH protein [Verrucomicrobiae bacterium]|nr:PVC-type heme-binding CxxCH protein [Verrucomicrobiae bacterium]
MQSWRPTLCLTAGLLGIFGTTGATQAQGYSPDEAVARMSLPPGVAASLVAAEPMVRQPVCIEFDDRGRLWVIQYLQYPNPAGLTRTKVDRYSRTQYDRVPEPPPRGPRGADRITILSDTNHDGRADTAKDFISGLNLASGLAFGHGGVFVLQVPYLLFYADRNHDDVPDGDPEVLLTGFGMEDAHSVANSLTWGPDGWLYGCQGSTVTAHIRGLEFQQGVWRYHPVTREFELFCEGGGNAWGLDFDDEGELIYSTNLGPYRMTHGHQGAYYWKSFAKHGALHHRFAYGYFDHVAHTNFTGGHVTVGGLIYRGTNLPSAFRGRYIAGDLLGHGVQWHELFPWGSTFTSRHGGDLLQANDTWFACSDLTVGPDGAIYVADWYDQRTAHPDPDAAWDRSNGRIFRLAAPGTQPGPPPDLVSLASQDLLKALQDGDHWTRQKVRRLLADRRDPSVHAALGALALRTDSSQRSLEALWALHVSGGFNEDTGRALLRHPSGPVRKWAVRLLGDRRFCAPQTSRALADLAVNEPDVRVRAQLAASARRLPVAAATPILGALLHHSQDAADPHLPLLLWWAVEQHALGGHRELLSMFTSQALSTNALMRDFVLERLLRRWSAEARQETDDACAQLLAKAGEAQIDRWLAALELGRDEAALIPAGPGVETLFGVPAQPTAPATPTNTVSHARARAFSQTLREQLQTRWRPDTTNTVLIRLLLGTGDTAAHARAQQLLRGKDGPAALRTEAARALGRYPQPGDAEALFHLVCSDLAAPESLRLAALEAVATSPPAATDQADRLLGAYRGLSPQSQVRWREVLLSRKDWARRFLEAVNDGRVVARDIPAETMRVVAFHHDAELDQLVRRHWGKVSGGTPEEKLAEIRRLNNDLRAAPGNPVHGQPIFLRLCATCHTLFGQGAKIGPDLTHANRADRDFLLTSLLDPSAVVRKEYLAYEVQLTDGRLLSGLLTEQTDGRIIVTSSTGEHTTLNRGQIKETRESALSLMPEGLVETLTPQELRDLFAWLQKNP